MVGSVLIGLRCKIIFWVVESYVGRSWCLDHVGSLNLVLHPDHFFHSKLELCFDCRWPD